jgi:hypothetical protein
LAARRGEQTPEAAAPEIAAEEDAPSPLESVGEAVQNVAQGVAEAAQNVLHAVQNVLNPASDNEKTDEA